MEEKNIVATIYLKDGKAVKSFSDHTEVDDVFALAKLYNNNGADKIIIFDLSTEEEEHEKHLHLIEQINRMFDTRVCAGGNINRVEDVKKLLYAGCGQVIFSAAKGSALGLAEMFSSRFGKDRVLLSVKNLDFVFKNQSRLESIVHELLVLDPGLVDGLEGLTQVPYVVYLQEGDEEKALSVLKRDHSRGIAGDFINDPKTDLMALKSGFAEQGILMDNFAPSLTWSELKKNSDGMVPVIVQDYRTDEVLMLAYMNEEAFNTTIRIGKMTYWSRSRNELWIKGETSGHYQYVKSLTADCDLDTILAKVSQVGAACHTGSYSCFFNSIIKKEYVEKNPKMLLESLYQEIQEKQKNPEEGTYAGVLWSKGQDEVLRRFGKTLTDMIIDVKNEKPVNIKYDFSELLYHMMVLMAQKDMTWDDILQELSKR